MHANHVQQGHNPLLQAHYSAHIPNAGHMSNGHNGATHPPQPHRNPSQHSQREPVSVVGIPSVTVENDELVVGGSDSSSTRSYTPLKVIGDGSFGTVWLCDWHGTLPPNAPMSAMQCGAGASLRPEYAGKRLVAVKRMKRRWEGGWDDCQRLKELESLRAIPYHPNIIPLYDFFLLPTTKELYFVFESMEGNLYQLIKARKGKPLAGGLVSSIFRQVVDGLHHIHASGYFHRDMKPENLLVTTTGLYDYRPVSPQASPDAPPERDVVVIVKLADFGLARETKSKPPYTEYVSTRWYRAPEVLLKSRDYSNPVDMWALGTIMAELVNLRPLFPGQGELDQVGRICDLLGDPGEDYGTDSRGKLCGGGQWLKGVKLARATGWAFPKIQPKNIYALFDRAVPIKLVDCIADLLKYDPDVRLTSRQCLEHPYLLETTPLNNPPGPPTPSTHTAARSNHRNGSATSLPSITPRHIPTSHDPKVHSSASPHIIAPIPDASASHRAPFYDRRRTFSDTSQGSSDYGGIVHTRRPELAHILTHQSVESSTGTSSSTSCGMDRAPSEWHPQQARIHQEWDAMDVSPNVDIPPEPYVTNGPQTDIPVSPMVQEYPHRPVEPEPIQDNAHVHGHNADVVPQQGNKFPKLGSLGFGKKRNGWGLGGMFGHNDKQHPLPPVQEVSVASAGSTPSLKRTSSSADSRSLSEISPEPIIPDDPKSRKKEAERMAKEAERQRRLRAEKTQREQARAVMKNQRRLAQAASGKELSYLSTHGHSVKPYNPRDWDKSPQADAATGPIRQGQNHGVSTLTVNAAGGSFTNPPSEKAVKAVNRVDWRGDSERVSKARRREFDDDHSMSSSDLHSGVSVISFASVDSDPGPSRLRNRPSAYGISRMTSMSSLQTASMDDFPSSERSSNSFSLEQQLVNEFHIRASVDSSSISDGGSPQPPPMHMLSLSSPVPWQHSDLSSSTVDNRSIGSARQTHPSPLSPPPHPPHLNVQHYPPSGPQSPYDGAGIYAQPPSPGMAPKSAINPIFKVSPSIPTVHKQASLSLTSLPPFSQLEAVADGEYPPLSPMSFTIPEDVTAEDS